MKAAVLHTIESLRIQDVAIPTPSDREILIKVKVCTICGTDIRVYHYGHKHIRFPRITGHEVSGEIVEVGKRVKDYKIGQRVAVAPVLPCGKCYYCQRGMQSMCLDLKAIGYHFDGEFYVVGTHGSAPYHNQLALNILSQNRVKVKDLITHRLPLEKLEEGIHLAESGKTMKVAIFPQK